MQIVDAFNLTLPREGDRILQCPARISALRPCDDVEQAVERTAFHCKVPSFRLPRLVEALHVCNALRDYETATVFGNNSSSELRDDRTDRQLRLIPFQKCRSHGAAVLTDKEQNCVSRSTQVSSAPLTIPHPGNTAPLEDISG